MTETPIENISSVSSWKKPKNPILTLPSGQRVRVFNPGMKTFLVNGVVPNSLMVLAEKALQKGQPLDKQAMDQLMNDPKKIADMLKFVDDLTVSVVIEPKIHPTPADSSDRNDELLYVDEVDDEDKLFIFTWATGGTSDVERFRTEVAGTLGALQSGNDVALPTV